MLVRFLTKQHRNPLSLSLLSSCCPCPPSFIIHLCFIVQFFIHPSYPHPTISMGNFGALRAGGHCTQLTLSFSNQDGGLVEEPTTSPFLPSPSLKLPLSNSALPNQALGGIASGLGMQNLNSSRQVRLLGKEQGVVCTPPDFLTW